MAENKMMLITVT